MQLVEKWASPGKWAFLYPETQSGVIAYVHLPFSFSLTQNEEIVWLQQD